LVLTCLVLNGCTPIYGPATVGTDIPYMAKPWTDSAETAQNYASVRYAKDIENLGPDQNQYRKQHLCFFVDLWPAYLLGAKKLWGINTGYGMSNDIVVNLLGIWLQVNRVTVQGTIYALSGLSDLAQKAGLPNNNNCTFQLGISYALSN